MHPVIVRCLEPGSSCLPPPISKKRNRPRTTRIRKQERPRKKEAKCSNMWGRQESHNKRSCRTANDNMASQEGEDSDSEVQAEEVLETIIVWVLIQRCGNRECRRRQWIEP